MIESYDNNKQSNKIKPFQAYTKIQETRPTHLDNLVNKELGYDSIVELPGQDNHIKIKECICSARANSELFKRFSKNLIYNIKNQIDQVYFFTSQNSPSRLQTSIGTKSNPGIFIIVGLTYLDEKYKQAHHRCDIEFSFLQFREGLMYDLMSYTEKPLKPQFSTTTEQFHNFNQTWVKASTFNQFIKLLKIAVFNNKERDFKSQKRADKLKSTFIMKIRSKIYSLQNRVIRQQEAILIDYEPNCFKETNNIKEKANNKSTLDYYLIEINNCNPNNKPFYYHLVEENHLFLLFKKYLPKMAITQHDNNIKQPIAQAQVTFLISLPSRQETFLQNYAYQQNIISHYSDSWEIKIRTKPKFAQTLNFGHVESQLKCISRDMSLNTYSSLRSYNGCKQQLISQVKKYKNNLRELRRLILQYLREKIELIFLVNELVADEFKLIGSSIKSDHFKDFYNSKSYLQLEREIFIKTQAIKQQILAKEKDIQLIVKKMEDLKKREDEHINKFDKIKQNENPIANVATPFSSPTQSKQHTPFQTKQQFYHNNVTADPKFKLLSIKRQSNQKEELSCVISYLYKYIYNLWDKVCLSNERTVQEYIALQENIGKQEDLLKDIIQRFIEDIQSIQETEIMYEQENNQHNSNEIELFRSLNFLGIMTKKKNHTKGYDVGKRILININSRDFKSHDKKQIGSICKLPSIKQCLVIRGDLKISQLLCNPFQVQSSIEQQQQLNI